MPKHYFADSSFITHIEHENSTLIVTFASNSVWAYYNVSRKIYNELISSDSHGSYFNKNIRNKYSSEVLFKLSKNSKIIYSKEESIGQEEEI